MKLSIITVCFNSEKTIKETFESVLKQEYDNLEYIVVDGLSTDSTMQIVKEYKKKFDESNKKLIYLSEKDKGIYDAMNKGIKLSTGDIVGILNSDDWYEDGIFKNISEEFLKDETIDIIYGNMNFFNPKKKEKRIFKSEKPELLLESMKIFHPTVFVKKKVYDKLVFNIKNKIASDYEFLLENYLNGLKFKYLDLTITNFRLGGESSKNEIIGYIEVLKIQRKNKVKGLKKYGIFLKKISLCYIKKINLLTKFKK